MNGKGCQSKMSESLLILKEISLSPSSHRLAIFSSNRIRLCSSNCMRNVK